MIIDNIKRLQKELDLISEDLGDDVFSLPIPSCKSLGKTKSKKEKREAEIQERQEFIDVYTEFNKWLRHLGFRSANYKESMSPLSYSWSHYNEHIDSLFGVEYYICEPINYRIYFLRDRYEHKLMFVGEIGSCSEVITLEQAKEVILKDVRMYRDEKLSELQKINLD